MNSQTEIKQGVTHLKWGEVWPSPNAFHELADQGYRVIPVVRRVLADALTPVGLYQRLTGGKSGSFILESAENKSWSRYSFIGVHSMAQLRSEQGMADWLGTVPSGVPTHGDVISVLEKTLDILQSPKVKGLPDLTGGLVGSVGWDAIRHWEKTVSAQAPNETGQPELALTLATDMAVIDHYDGSVWFISNAINLDNSDDREQLAYADALDHIIRMQNKLTNTSGSEITYANVLDESKESPQPLLRTSEKEFISQIDKAKQHVIDGDIFQVVISNRVDIDSPADPFDVYRVLRTLNPSPYMYYFSLTGSDGNNFNIIGSSPETLIKVVGREAMTFPIAGSRPRGATIADDTRLEKELLADAKERSEHTMLVDLSRNDLSQVCVPGSVEVTDFMKVVHFSHIMHIASTVVGTIDPKYDALDVFKATFPAGTLTGAPKHSAINIIDDIEPADRGIYGGTVGYFDFTGAMDMAIAIRTAYCSNGKASVQSGAGIVLDSVPENEWIESRNKAESSVEAFQIASKLRLM